MNSEHSSTAASGATIEVRDLTLDFRAPRWSGAKSLRALDSVSIDIAPGEIVGLVGESGSGKTTLGKTILGACAPSSGEIRYAGRDLASLAPRQWGALRRDLQMIFQDPLSSFNPRFTIESSLSLPLRLHRVCSRNKVGEEVVNLLRRVGLGPEHARRYPHELSGGQLQRVAVARAISVRPRVIVADEPVSKLDVSVRAQVLNLLKRMNSETGISLVFITHDLGVARFICDRIAVMYFGRLVEVGATEQIFGDAQHPYTQSLLAARNSVAGLVATEADEIELKIDNLAHACNYARRCPKRVEQCIQQRPFFIRQDETHASACFVADRQPTL
jgi:oligopeptide/dipeptide ABC transporter ATP-binding protein